MLVFYTCVGMALTLMAAVAVGLWVTLSEVERKGFKREHIYDVAIWIFLGGLAGARLFHVIDHWPDKFAAAPIRALYIWEGGLAIWGLSPGGSLPRR